MANAGGAVADVTPLLLFLSNFHSGRNSQRRNGRCIPLFCRRIHGVHRCIALLYALAVTRGANKRHPPHGDGLFWRGQIHRWRGDAFKWGVMHFAWSRTAAFNRHETFVRYFEALNRTLFQPQISLFFRILGEKNLTKYSKQRGEKCVSFSNTKRIFKQSFYYYLYFLENTSIFTIYNIQLKLKI